MARARSLVFAVFIAALPPALSQAQEPYPSRLVKVVLPVAPGSTTDILARLVTIELGQKWGRPVIVREPPVQAPARAVR